MVQFVFPTPPHVTQVIFPVPLQVEQSLAVVPVVPVVPEVLVELELLEVLEFEEFDGLAFLHSVKINTITNSVRSSKILFFCMVLFLNFTSKVGLY